MSGDKIDGDRLKKCRFQPIVVFDLKKVSFWRHITDPKVKKTT